MRKSKNRGGYFKPVSQPKSQKQMLKEFRKEYAKSLKKKPSYKTSKITPVNPEKELADKWNVRFRFAASKLKAGSSDIAMYLDPILRKLSGKDIISANENNQYFSVDSSYDGDVNKLFQHVTFKKIPDDMTDVTSYFDQIESVKGTHLSPGSYEQFSKDWHSKSYNTLAQNLTLSNYEILEEIMNSSPAWSIAKRNAMDSEQVLDRWLELYEVMNHAQQTDTGIFDWAVQQIENGKHGLDWLINAIDDEISLMLAGKYSQRRKVRY